MSEHAVRLRARWDLTIPDRPDDPAVKVDLPLDWGRIAEATGREIGRVRLTRPFGRPLQRPGDPAPPTARLVMENSDGLQRVEFNGAPIPWRDAASGVRVADLPDLEARNVVTLDVDAPTGTRGVWGSVAVVFDATDPGSGR